MLKTICIPVFIILLILANRFAFAGNTGLECSVCGEAISGQCVTSGGKAYHKDCYNEVAPRCGVCGRILDGAYIVSDNESYHKNCFMEIMAPRCSVCNEPIAGQYSEDFWGLQYHPEHEKTHKACEYCRRLISEFSTGGGQVYDDGRAVCNICYNEAEMNHEEIEAIVQHIKAVLSANGIIIDMSDVPINLVDLDTLMELSGNPGNSEKGFCLYQYRKVGNMIITQSNTIYMLTGMPERYFEGVLAHEMMHVWMNLNCDKELELKLNEGMANYAAYLVYSNHYDELAEFFLQNLQEDPDDVYGDGFREVLEYVDGNGIQSLLEYLKSHSIMP
ncbi:MAG: protein DA1 [Desulfobacterales bacterium]|nr:protein DA1 [Desulfobacterales bacterium]